MSMLNPTRRVFNTVYRNSTILHPALMDAKMSRDWTPSRQDYIDVPTITTRGTWPAVHMIPEDTFVEMAILAGHIDGKASKRKRKA